MKIVLRKKKTFKQNVPDISFCLVSMATAASSQDSAEQQMGTEDPFMQPNDELLMISQTDRNPRTQ